MAKWKSQVACGRVFYNNILVFENIFTLGEKMRSPYPNSHLITNAQISSWLTRYQSAFSLRNYAAALEAAFSLISLRERQLELTEQEMGGLRHTRLPTAGNLSNLISYYKSQCVCQLQLGNEAGFEQAKRHAVAVLTYVRDSYRSSAQHVRVAPGTRYTATDKKKNPRRYAMTFFCLGMLLLVGSLAFVITSTVLDSNGQNKMPSFLSYFKILAYIGIPAGLVIGCASCYQAHRINSSRIGANFMEELLSDFINFNPRDDNSSRQVPSVAQAHGQTYGNQGPQASLFSQYAHKFSSPADQRECEQLYQEFLAGNPRDDGSSPSNVEMEIYINDWLRVRAGNRGEVVPTAASNFCGYQFSSPVDVIAFYNYFQDYQATNPNIGANFSPNQMYFFINTWSHARSTTDNVGSSTPTTAAPQATPSTFFHSSSIQKNDGSSTNVVASPAAATRTSSVSVDNVDVTTPLLPSCEAPAHR